MAFNFNTLVLSDLHLGEDLSPTATEVTRQHTDVVERELVAFLRHYAQCRRDGRPWRLVFNGDLVDFISICLHPEAGAGADDQALGLARTPTVACAKVEAVGRRHRAFFIALARFLSRGNRVEIISGNHDTEFHWPTTQTAFCEVVAAAWNEMPESQRDGAMSAAQLTDSIAFHPWFFYDEGVAWIEHGHQYDECCSHEYQLYPRNPKSDEIVLNVDSAGTRYVTNRLPDAEAHMQEDWSALGYLKWGWELGFIKSVKTLSAYFDFSRALLRVWRAHTNRRARLEIERGHHQRLGALADKWSLPESKLARLDDLRRRPVIGHLRKLVAVLMLDKLIAYVSAAVIALLAILFVPLPWGAATAATSFLLARLVTAYTGRGRMIDAGMDLQLTSEKILREVDAEIVVFGHTHRPVGHQLESGSWYFNTGTWVPNGRPGLLRAFTHLVICHSESGPVASLCQWRDGASRAFTPGWAPEGPIEPVSAPIGAPEPETARAA